MVSHPQNGDFLGFQTTQVDLSKGLMVGSQGISRGRQVVQELVVVRDIPQSIQQQVRDGKLDGEVAGRESADSVLAALEEIVAAEPVGVGSEGGDG